MSEAAQPGAGARRTSPRIDQFCDALREGMQSVVDAFTPPESACNHFQEARIEVLRGLRDIIDHRIEHLSRPKRTGGTKIVVE